MMKKLSVLTLFFLCTFSLFSQNIEFIGGVNHNKFFYTNDDGADYSQDEKIGFEIFAGLEDIKLGFLNLRFTLGYKYYGGEFENGSSGAGGSYKTEANVDKHVFSVGLFPLNYKIMDKLDVNVGVELAALIAEDVDGSYSSSWGAGGQTGGSNNFDLNDKYDPFSNKICVGLRGRLAYDINLSEKWIISPQYSFYYGLSDEFEHSSAIQSMRHFFGIGFQKSLH